MAQLKFGLQALRKGVKIPVGQGHVITVLPGGPRRVRLVGMFFELNKCFLLPTAMKGIRAIKTAYDEHQGANLLIVGHTDTSGDPAPNLKLSLERADSVAAFLKDDVAAWEAFFAADKDAGKRWGTREIQFMLSALPEGSGPGDGFYSAKVNGALDAATQKAIKEFQQSEGVKPDGAVTPALRKALLKRYMSIDATTLPADIALTTHGCGENFPVKDTADGKRSPDDRRVELYFFDGPITPAPPGKTSAKGAPEPPQWVSQAEDTVDVSADAIETGTVPFRYGVQVGDAAPWSDQAVLRITSVDGSDERKFPVASGQAVGEYRFFEFPDAKPGLKYQGFMEEGASFTQVFGAVELVRLVDQEDDTNHLPLPESQAAPAPLAPAPVPPPGPAVADDPDFDDQAVATAAKPKLGGEPLIVA